MPKNNTFKKKNHGFAQNKVPLNNCNNTGPYSTSHPYLYYVKCSFTNNILSILILLSALFFMITFTNPGLVINDEWITANQLHQLDIGHQIVYNEGKYGTYDNGTASRYFEARNNQLGYTLMLPLLSLPVLKLFSVFGDNFRYVIILLWAVLPVMMALMIQMYYPKYAKCKGIDLLWIIVPVMFLLFMLNMLYYAQFPFIATDAPREVAAIVFTQHLIIAAMAVLIYHICMELFESKWFSLFGVLACIGCSTYLFWAGSAKDHMLVAFLFAIVIFFMIRYLKRGHHHNAGLSFLFSGLLAWGRPEVALPVFAFTTIFFLALSVKKYLYDKKDVKSLIVSIITPAFTVIGALPYFLNNMCVTGNPLTPTFDAFSKKYMVSEAATSPASQTVTPLSDATIDTTPISIGIQGLYSRVIGFYSSIPWTSLPGDILGILFDPSSGAMGLLAVTPLLGIAVVFLIYFLLNGKCVQNKSILLYLAIAALAVFVAYSPSVHIMNVDEGILPDVRYLSPAYLPIGLLGLIAIYPLVNQESQKSLTTYTLLLFIIAVPVILLAAMMIQPFSGTWTGYTDIFTLLVYVMLPVTLATGLLSASGRINNRWFLISLMLVILMSTSWQMLGHFIYSGAKFNGYPFWIPIIDNIYNSLFSVVHL